MCARFARQKTYGPPIRVWSETGVRHPVGPPWHSPNSFDPAGCCATARTSPKFARSDSENSLTILRHCACSTSDAEGRRARCALQFRRCRPAPRRLQHHFVLSPQIAARCLRPRFGRHKRNTTRQEYYFDAASGSSDPNDPMQAPRPLPVVLATEAPRVHADGASAETTSLSTCIAPYHILIVDDAAEVRAFVSEALRTLGYDVHTASCANEALALAARTPYNLVVCDLRLPGVRGLELVERLRRLDPDRAMIILTGVSSDDPDVRRLHERGTTVLHKPVRLAQLQTTVAQALRTLQA
jgi:CheY-like chemotaxis protein